MVSPIARYHQKQLDIHDFISTHTGTASQLVDILNKASLSYSHSLLSKYDSTLNRANKRTIVKVGIGKPAKHHIYGNIFYNYLHSVLVNPKVTFSDLLSDTPYIDLFDTQHHTTLVTSIYLNSISNVSIESMTESDIDFSQYIISYHNEANSLDYQMCVTIYK